MNEPQKIDLPLFDLKYQKNPKKIHHYMVLYPTKLLFVIECYMDSYPKPDDDLGVIIEDQYLNQVDSIRKDGIYWIKRSFSNEFEIWTVEIFFGSQDTYVNFETQEKAEAFYNTLMVWLGW